MVFPIARSAENQRFKLVGNQVMVNRMVGNAQGNAALLKLHQKVALHLKNLRRVKMNPMMQSDNLKGTGDRFVDLARSDDLVKWNACLPICGNNS